MSSYQEGREHSRLYHGKHAGPLGGRRPCHKRLSDIWNVQSSDSADVNLGRGQNSELCMQEVQHFIPGISSVQEFLAPGAEKIPLPESPVYDCQLESTMLV